MSETLRRQRLATPADVAGPADELAPKLLGTHLVRHLDDGSTIRARIVETEAYRQSDPASHAARGKTPRNSSMFASAGTAYVYRSYGVHWCLNCVAEPSGIGAGVLLRAAELVEGHTVVRRARPHVRDDSEFLRGPGCLARGMYIDGPGFDGVSLLDPNGALQLEVPGDWQTGEETIANGPRVGVSQAADTPWRFWIEANPAVSQYRRAQATRL